MSMFRVELTLNQGFSAIADWNAGYIGGDVNISSEDRSVFVVTDKNIA
jgi:hypothetical protein